MKFNRTVEKNNPVICLLSSVFCLFLLACDSPHGPWSYYPEDTEVFQGIYTHGYIVADHAPYICFSKVYELDETSAENFAFYDSASVTVSGVFQGRDSSEIVLQPVAAKPNCFEVSDSVNGIGIAGKSYTMNAFFKWDSSGNKVETAYKAVAKIPTKIHAKSLQPPSNSLKNNNRHIENNYEYIDVDFLEFPNDLHTYNIPMEYDESVRGILMTMRYDNINGGESQNTTLTSMFKSFMKPDSVGYYGMSSKHPEENVAQLGYSARMNVGGYNSLDTMTVVGMILPIGKNTIRFYATDQAYADYKNKVLESLEDPRVTPESNVENGMGVFSGMLADSILVEVHSDNYVGYDHILVATCETKENKMMGSAPFSTKGCRLVEDSLCLELATGGVPWEYYLSSDFSYNEACATSILKQMLYEWESIKASSMPTYSAEKFSGYYDMAKARYCIENNFTTRSFCAEYETLCLKSDEKNDYNEAMWEWCSDRGWDIETYEQCGLALLNRIEVEKIKSPILERVADSWCSEHAEVEACKKL